MSALFVIGKNKVSRARKWRADSTILESRCHSAAEGMRNHSGHEKLDKWRQLGSDRTLERKNFVMRETTAICGLKELLFNWV